MRVYCALCRKILYLSARWTVHMHDRSKYAAVTLTTTITTCTLVPDM